MIFVGSMSLWLLFDDKPGFGITTYRTKSLVAAAVLFDAFFSWT